MNLSISNIAWDPPQDPDVAKILQYHQVRGIDIAPGKYFTDPTCVSLERIDEVKGWWADCGIAIVGMQALMFGTTGLNLFGDRSVRAAMLLHLESICRIGGRLGATRVVFGSPKNRDRAGLSDDHASDVAVGFFSELAARAQENGVLICLEPNPERYGSNFMLNCTETASIVSMVDHPALKMQLDTGSLVINSEDVNEILSKYSSLIGHVHASEPNLVPLGGGETDHALFGAAVLKFLPTHWVTIEMLTSSPTACLREIDTSISVASSFYRTFGAEGLQ